MSTCPVIAMGGTCHCDGSCKKNLNWPLTQGSTSNTFTYEPHSAKTASLEKLIKELVDEKLKLREEIREKDAQLQAYRTLLKGVL